MVPPHKLKELIQHTVEELSYDKQQEVYDFAQFLKEKKKTTIKKSTRKTSILSLIGIGESGCTDVALNHDKYLYE